MYPKSFSMSIELQNSMQFPSVTICNMNKFRVSTLESISELRHVFLYEMTLNESMEHILEELSKQTESKGSETFFTWCNIRPVSDPSMALAKKNESDTLTLEASDPGNAEQLFFFNDITGSIVSNDTGFCLINMDGTIGARSASCKEPDNVRKWMTRVKSANEGTHIFNSNGLAFSMEVIVGSILLYYYFTRYLLGSTNGARYRGSQTIFYSAL